MRVQVFWRGFFLTALTKVLPLPACVGFSSLNFAVLHLSPHNLLPLLVLSSCCDCLYLRSGGNLLAPLLLHGLWNTSQVLQIALLHKDTFV
jgi:membrane protease YdiL (CAAX protease family)